MGSHGHDRDGHADPLLAFDLRVKKGTVGS